MFRRNFFAVDDMGRIADALADLYEAEIPAAFKKFGSELDARWVAEALEATGKASMRRRKLPAETAVWLVIGMALFRDRSISEVVSHLSLALPDGFGDGSAPTVPSSAVKARARLGPEPLEWLFDSTANVWAHRSADHDRWRGLALYGVDGTTLRVQDTALNREAFGLPSSGSERGVAGYPQVRLVVLMALRSHLLVKAKFGPFAGKGAGEKGLSKSLWPELPDDSLAIVDRNFLDYGLLHRLRGDDEALERHWLIRAKKNTKTKLVRTLPDGSAVVELTISSHAKKKDPTLPKTVFAREITYRIGTAAPQRLLTSMLDAEARPAKEIVALYHERWELELGYGEIKTRMLDRRESLRSKKPEGVVQELWGILLAYNLVRRQMETVAQDVGLPPVRVSFLHSLHLIRVFCFAHAWLSSPGTIPKHLTEVRRTLGDLVLPPRRRHRRYPRHVKIKMSSYPRNTGKPT